jgi:hypothetical protein
LKVYKYIGEMDQELRDRFKAIKKLECLMRAADDEE